MSNPNHNHSESPPGNATTNKVCSRCDAALSGDVYECPECGLTPPNSPIPGLIMVVVGGLLSLTIIGAVIGIPIMLTGIAHIAASGSNSIATDP
jgi:hypothetical protein